MYINADIYSKPDSSLIIPDDGVVTFGNAHFVFEVLQPGKYKMLEVIPGVHTADSRQISFKDSSISADKTFVISGAYTLLMQLKNTEEE
ncbi:MAG TPA: hypothetical protein DEU93_07555 [Chitinophagaceae bacterium]|nr:hypothetical protein [Chitinophagaceae bacterium]